MDVPAPSSAEAMLFYNILKNIKNTPDIDWDQVAVDASFKNAATARKRFYQIKKKLGLDKASPTTSSPSSPSVSPTKVTKRRSPKKGIKTEHDHEHETADDASEAV